MRRRGCKVGLDTKAFPRYDQNFKDALLFTYLLQEKDEDAAYMSHVQRHGTGVDFKYRGGPANEAEVGSIFHI